MTRSAVKLTIVVAAVISLTVAQEYQWPVTGEGTKGNQGRKIVRVPGPEGEDYVHLVWPTLDPNIRYAVSPDGGGSWTDPPLLVPTNPCYMTFVPLVQSDATNRPWALYQTWSMPWNYYDAQYDVSRRLMPQPDWRIEYLTYVGDYFYREMSGTLSEAPPVQAEPSMMYAVVTRDIAFGGDEDRVSELWFFAFDTLRAQPYYATPLASAPFPFEFQPTIDYTPGDFVHVAYRDPEGHLLYKTWLSPVTKDEFRQGEAQPVWSEACRVSEPRYEPASSPSIDADGNRVFCAWRGPNEDGQNIGEIYRKFRDLTLPPWQWLGHFNASQSPDQESDHPQCHTFTTITWHEHVAEPDNWEVFAAFCGEIRNLSNDNDANDQYPHGAVRNPVPPEPFVIYLHTAWTKTGPGPRCIQYALRDYTPADFASPEYPSYLAGTLGQPEQSPFCRERDGFKRYAGGCVDYGFPRLVYELPYLNPGRDYLAELVLLNGEATAITQSFVVDGRRLLRVTLQPGESDTVRVFVPRTAYRNTRAVLEVVREAGPFACLADCFRVYEMSRRGQEDGPNASPTGGPGSVVRVLPNPFRNSCVVHFGPHGSAQRQAAVYDANGRLVRHLTVLSGSGGIGAAPWDGTDRTGRQVPAGVYYCKAATAAGSSCIRVVKQ